MGLDGNRWEQDVNVYFFVFLDRWPPCKIMGVHATHPKFYPHKIKGVHETYPKFYHHKIKGFHETYLKFYLHKIRGSTTICPLYLGLSEMVEVDNVGL